MSSGSIAIAIDSIDYVQPFFEASIYADIPSGLLGGDLPVSNSLPLTHVETRDEVKILEYVFSEILLDEV